MLVHNSDEPIIMMFLKQVHELTEVHKLHKKSATRLATAGMPVHVLQKRRGHKNLTTTRKYLADVDLSSKEHTDVVEKATYTSKLKVVKKSGTGGD